MLIVVLIVAIFLRVTWSVTKILFKLFLIVGFIGLILFIKDNYANPNDLLVDITNPDDRNYQIEQTPNYDLPIFQEQMEFYSSDNQKMLRQQKQLQQENAQQAPTAENYKKLLEDGPNGPRQLRGLEEDAQPYHDLPLYGQSQAQGPRQTPLIDIGR